LIEKQKLISAFVCGICVILFITIVSIIYNYGYFRNLEHYFLAGATFSLCILLVALALVQIATVCVVYHNITKSKQNQNPESELLAKGLVKLFKKTEDVELKIEDLHKLIQALRVEEKWKKKQKE